MREMVGRGKTISTLIGIFIGIIVGSITGIAIITGYKYYFYYYKEMPIRQQLFSELRTVTLENCNLKRFGDAHDGGYLLCENLIQDVTSAYSYGIEGRDKWGCDVSNKYNLIVHQYDCFDTKRPVCEGGNCVFHEECVGDKYFISENRTFDSLKNQIVKNNDEKKKLIVKMDVEGAEWDTFLATPDGVLNNIDQLIVEFHGSDQKKYIEVIRKLKNIFYLIHVHFNNYGCDDKIQPFPAKAYEVLFVNKRIGKLNNNGTAPGRFELLDSPNSPKIRDCQLVDSPNNPTIKDFCYAVFNDLINGIRNINKMIKDVV